MDHFLVNPHRPSGQCCPVLPPRPRIVTRVFLHVITFTEFRGVYGFGDEAGERPMYGGFIGRGKPLKYLASLARVRVHTCVCATVQ